MIRAYAFNKAWVIGFLMDISGAMLMLRALSLAPVSTSEASFFLYIYVNPKKDFINKILVLQHLNRILQPIN